MNQLTEMFEGQQLRIVEKENDPWFVAKDVCDILEIRNPTDALKRLDEDERARFNLGRQGEANMVNEYGLYSLILGSRKAEAKRFKRWVTHEVIPSIRKTGKYEAPNSLQILQETVNQMVSMDGRVTYLEDHMRVDGIQEKRLKDKAKSVAIESLGGTKTNAYKKISRKIFSGIWRDFNNHFNLPRYSELPRKQFEEGLRFLGMWQPSTSLRIEIQEHNDQQTINEVI